MTILLHAAVITVLLQFQPVRSALTQAVPIMVSLITPPSVVEKPKELPRPLPVKPRTQRAEPRPEPPPLVAAVTDALQPPEAPAPQPIAPSPPAPVAAAPASPPPAPVVPPNFNAAYLNNPAPAYPTNSRRFGHQGRVILRVLVNAEGNPDKVEIRTSSGFSQLDDAAFDAVRRWRFVPARQGDRPAAAWVLVPIIFTLES